jgi:hypothetical protein
MGIIEHTQSGIVVKIPGTVPMWSAAAMVTAMRFVTSPCSPVTTPRPEKPGDGYYTHDICRTPAAVANILRQLQPGARVTLAGM